MEGMSATTAELGSNPGSTGQFVTNGINLFQEAKLPGTNVVNVDAYMEPF